MQNAYKATTLQRVAVEWITIGRSVLEEAQQKVDRSDQWVAQRIPKADGHGSIGTNTWRNWKRDGQIRAYALEDIAEVLNLKLERAPMVVTLPEPDEEQPPAELLPRQMRHLRRDHREALEELADSFQNDVRSVLDEQRGVLQEIRQLLADQSNLLTDMGAALTLLTSAIERLAGSEPGAERAEPQ